MGLPIIYGPVRWVIMILLLIGTASYSVANKKIPVAPTPTWVHPITLKINTQVQPNEVSGGYHSLLRDSQYNLPGKTIFGHHAFKVFSEDGIPPVSEITIDYDPNYQKLLFHAVRIWRNGQVMDKRNAQYKVIQREQDREKYIYNEEQSAIIILDDVRIGDVVEYSYSLQGRNPVFGEKFFNTFYLESYDPVDEIFIKILTTPQRPLFIKLDNTKTKPGIVTANNQRTYTWHLKNVPGKTLDSEVPSWYDPFACVYVSEFKSWSELVNWALPLYAYKTPLSKELQEEIDRIKKEYGSMDDRIVASVRFVQDKIRYLGFENGISGYKPFPPDKVFKQRFGDCKDKSLLLVTMLRELGIEAHPALVNTTYKGQVQSWLPSVYAFNHCIVMAEFMGKKIWIDPTINLQRGKYDSIATPDYKAALLIKKGATGFTKMQVPRNAKIKVTETFTFKDIGGPVTFEVKTEYFGLEADRQRSNFASTTTRQMEKDYLNYYANAYPDIAVDRKLVFVDDAHSNKFTTFEEYTIKDLWQTDDKNKDLLSADFYPQMIRDRLLMPKTLIRKNPFGIAYPLDIEHTFRMYMPEVWATETATKTISDKTFFYQRNSSYEASIRCISYTYKYKNLQDFVPVAGASAYIRHQKAIIADMGFQLQKDKSVTASRNNFSLNWWMVLFAVATFALAGFGAYRLYRYNPPYLTYSPEGYPIGSWLILVAIGLCFTPIRMLFAIVDASYFNLNMFKEIIDPASTAYNMPLAVVLVAELIINISFLVYAILLLHLFFNRRTSLPRLISVFYIANLAFILADAIAGEVVYGNAITWVYAPVIGAFIFCALWVSYFKVSIRVKETFVNRLQEPADAPQKPVFKEPVAAAGEGL